MTSKQLFALNDPHWVLGMPYNLASVLHEYRETLSEIGHLDELIDIYDYLYDGKQINWELLRQFD